MKRKSTVLERKLMNENGEWESVAKIVERLQKKGFPEDRIQMWLVGLDVDYLARCPHLKTVALNEDGYAGVFCSECGKQLEKEV